MWELDSLTVGPKRETDTLEAWHEVVSSNHAELAFSVGKPSAFHAMLARQDLGDVGVLLFEGTALSAARTRPAISRASTGQTMLIWQLSGLGRVRQSGRDESVAEGDVVILNMDEPYVFDCLGAFRQIVVNVPTEALTTRLRLLGGREDFQAKPVGYGGLAAPSLAFMRETVRQLQMLGAVPLMPLRSPFLDAFAAVALIAGGARANEPSLLKLRVIDFLARNHSRHKLTSEAVAKELGVSRRTLFRAFDGDELGLHGHLLRLRLDASRKLLESPNHTYPIDAVARLSGFSSSSNFTARFTDSFRLTPAAYRTRFSAGSSGLALSES
jgi:AraC-like DNA-binding protein